MKTLDGVLQSEQPKLVQHKVVAKNLPVQRRSLANQPCITKRQLDVGATGERDLLEHNAALAECDLIERRLEALAFMQKRIDAQTAAHRS